MFSDAERVRKQREFGLVDLVVAKYRTGLVGAPSCFTA